MEIRVFKESDALTVSEIIRDVYEHQKLGDYSESIIAGQIEDNSPQKLMEYAKTTNYFVAIEEGELVGICGYEKGTSANPAFTLKQGWKRMGYTLKVPGWRPKNAVFGGAHRQKIRTMFVKRDRQNKGVGRMLLLRILEEAKRDGIAELGLWATQFAERFYARHGFITIGRIELPYKNEALVFVEMKIGLR